MRNLFYIATVLIIILGISPSHAVTRICYFSLNNQKEFKELDKFTGKLNKASKEEKIELREFVTENADAAEAFEKMVQSGTKCDGLVISGHHTGAWSGEKAQGTLELDFIERLACKKEHKEFFNQVKGLWLQGCRTAGAKKIVAEDTADLHMLRLEGLREEDFIVRPSIELNWEFSATLDQDNPLDSRYIRSFPRASIFGWSRTSPGVKTHSEYSIPFHLAHMARLLDTRGKYFANPLGEQIPAKDALKYLEAIEALLGKTHPGPDIECKALLAWKKHGGGSKKGYRYAFNNPYLKALMSLHTTNDQVLSRAKELECALKKAKDADEMIPHLETILKNRALIGLAFNSMYEIFLRFKKEGDTASLEKIRKAMRKSPHLNEFLMEKLRSEELGIIPKIDYYAFLRELKGKKDSKIEELINRAFKSLMLIPAKKSYEIRDFKETIVHSMAKQGVLHPLTLDGIVSDKKADAKVLAMAAKAIELSSVPIKGAALILEKILDKSQKTLKSKKETNMVRSRVAMAIGRSKQIIENASGMLKRILRENPDKKILQRVAWAVRFSKTPPEDVSGILKMILRNKKSDNHYTLAEVARVIARSQTPIEGAAEMLEQIKSSKRANRHTLKWVKRAEEKLKKQKK